MEKRVVKALLSLAALMLAMSSSGQEAAIDLTFTAMNNGMYVQLDSIWVKNLNQGGETVIHWPDTTLTVNITPGDLLLLVGYSRGFPVGISETTRENSSFQLLQNWPNPVMDQTEIPLFLPGNGTVSFIISDVKGRMMINEKKFLEAGFHSYTFIPGNEKVYFLSVQWNGISRNIKILTSGSDHGQFCRLDYAGTKNNDHTVKSSLLKSNLTMQESGIPDDPAASQTYTFQFATNIPCPGTPTVYYEGQIYHTIQIFSQCWLKENMNVGTMIPGIQNQADNGIVEKYCYGNNPDNCTQYGGLYQWNEMMQYTKNQGAQGICPPGWHIPTDEEWKVLDGAADSQYLIGDHVWNGFGFRGYDAGKNLKTTSGWNQGGNGTDLFGFSGMPAGNRDIMGSGGFGNISKTGYWWTSSEFDNFLAWFRYLNYSSHGADRDITNEAYGFSVRCLRDN